MAKRPVLDEQVRQRWPGDQQAPGTDCPYLRVMTLDLTEYEAAALVACLRHALEYDPYPFASGSIR